MRIAWAGIGRLNCGGKNTQRTTGAVIEVGKPHLRQRGGAHKRAIAVIPAGPAVQRILRHVGLPADSEDFTEVRGPPDELWPPDDSYDGAIDIPLFGNAAQTQAPATDATRAPPAVLWTGLPAAGEFRHFSA